MHIQAYFAAVALSELAARWRLVDYEGTKQTALPPISDRQCRVTAFRRGVPEPMLIALSRFKQHRRLQLFCRGAERQRGTIQPANQSDPAQLTLRISLHGGRGSAARSTDPSRLSTMGIDCRHGKQSLLAIANTRLGYWR